MPPRVDAEGQHSSQAYRIHQGETIVGQAFSNIAIILGGNYRVVYDDGTEDTFIFDNVTLTTSRAANLLKTNRIAIHDGYIVEGVMLNITTGTAVVRGQTYVAVWMTSDPASGPASHCILTASYLYNGHSPTLGEIIEPGPGGGHGFFTRVSLGQPAAGADYAAYTVPAGCIQRLRGLSAQLVTAVAAANRFWHVVVANSIPNTLTEFISDAIQTASLTFNYRGVYGGISPKTAATPNATGGMMLVSLPDTLLNQLSPLAPMTLTWTTDNIQGADQWTGVLILEVEEWVMPN